MGTGAILVLCATYMELSALEAVEPQFTLPERQIMAMTDSWAHIRSLRTLANFQKQGHC